MMSTIGSHQAAEGLGVEVMRENYLSVPKKLSEEDGYKKVWYNLRGGAQLQR